ncbi:MAG: transporter substrate-binding domain-containing protein [Victivallales bacterium]|nr:transporter substrate-binding domain-containing protein [Victivallales bacterium]
MKIKTTTNLCWILSIATLLVCLVAFMVYASGRFTSTPVVEVMPQNRFDKTVVAVADENYWPFTFKDRNGKPSGHDVELLNVIANRIGVNVNLQMLEWDDALSAAKEGKADIVLTCEYGDEESQDGSLIMTAATEYGDFVAFGKKHIDTVDELYSKKIGLLKNNNVFMVLHRHGLDGHCIYYSSNEEAIEGVIKGDCDYAVMRYVIGLGIIRNLGKAANGIKATTKIGESNMCIGVASTNPALADQVNNAIIELKQDGTLKRMNRKWLTSYVRPFTLSEIIADHIWIVPVLMFTVALIVYLLLTQNTLKRTHQQELEKALVLAQAASRAKTRFLNNMSHDIRTPMNAIIGFERMAIKNIDNHDKAVECLEKAKKSSELLLSIINDILDMSRIESGKTIVNESDEDLLLVFDEIQPMMLDFAATKDIALSFDFKDIDDRFVHIDFTHVARILVNLISNAIKYTNEGGWVKVRLRQAGKDNGCGKYIFTVEDNGIGISEEFQKELFTEFSRERNTTVSNIQGTGIGLALVKSLTTLLGGTISCVSQQGKGTTFTLELNLRLAQKTDSNASPKAKDSLDSTSLEGKRVLLVEDNELNREISQELLEELGMQVETAENGSIAVQKAKETGVAHYDFILMDIQMPVMNGYEATGAIRTLPDGDQVPIIALSANAFDEDKQKSRRAGMNNHISKPIKSEALVEALLKFQRKTNHVSAN